MLKSHREAIERFMENKALGEPGRHRFEDTERKGKEKGAKPLGGDPRTMRSLCSSSEGINPSPTRCIGRPATIWSWLTSNSLPTFFPGPYWRKKGVEVRIVRQPDWSIHLEDIEAQMDDRTRVVPASHLSYFTGHRLRWRRWCRCRHASTKINRKSHEINYS